MLLLLLLVVIAGCGDDGAAGKVTLVTSTASQVPGAASAGATPRASRPPRVRPTQVARAMRTIGCQKPFEPGDSIGEIQSGGEQRTYRLHVPTKYDPRRATPLLVSFHGYGQDAAQQDAYTGLPAFADAQSFVLVTPEGSGSPRGWDIPGIYNENGVDDVAFVNELVSSLGDSLCLDSRRIYATGHSNGAQMASQVACGLPWLFAAVAPVSGAVFQDCQGQGVPMIAFQGTEDYNVTFDESDEGVLGWVGHNGCPTDPEITQPVETIERRSWACSAGDVVFYVMNGVGHVWPGGDASAGGVGPTTDAIDANSLMWEFFRAHPHR